MIQWQDLHHSELTVASLYALLKLRCEVFVVEQTCPYQDIDGDDLIGENRHILGWRDNALVAYARILKSEDQLMEKTLEACQKQWPDKALYLGAQAHLQPFYGHFGFTPVTDVYDEDGIPHIGMAREAKQA